MPSRFVSLALATAFVAGTAALTAPGAVALPGDLDPSFDGDGLVVTDFGGDDFTSDVAVQADGKIVAVGTAATDFIVARYNPDGSLDTSFSGDGLLSTGFGAQESATSVAIQPDGKIVVAGVTNAGPNIRNFALARYRPSGAIDVSFDGDGLLFTDFGADEVALGLAVQPDGKVVAVGGTGVNGGDFAIARYNDDGSPDNGFDGDGQQTVDFGAADIAQDVVVQGDGSIVAAGTTFAGVGLSDFALARLSTGGTLDGGLDGDGRVVTNPGGTDFGNALAVQPDGRIVVAGDIDQGVSNSDAGLIRYLPGGALDPSFGGDGLVGIDLGATEGAQDLVVQPDGKIVVHADGFTIARLSTDGSLDPGFGSAGMARADFGADGLLIGMALQGDGAIVAAGVTKAGPNPDNFGIARFQGGEPPPPPDPEPPLRCRGREATIRAVPGAVTRGTPGNDVIVGTAKRDRIRGNGGRDLICTLRGRDRASGGGGADRVFGGGGTDRIVGGGGRDFLVGGAGRRDRCFGGPGRDVTRSC